MQLVNMHNVGMEVRVTTFVLCGKAVLAASTTLRSYSNPHPRMGRNPKVLSGQHTSKGRIKATAHAKDGDCFGCIILPLEHTIYYQKDFYLKLKYVRCMQLNLTIRRER